VNSAAQLSLAQLLQRARRHYWAWRASPILWYGLCGASLIVLFAGLIQRLGYTPGTQWWLPLAAACVLTAVAVAVGQRPKHEQVAWALDKMLGQEDFYRCALEVSRNPMRQPVGGTVLLARAGQTATQIPMPRRWPGFGGLPSSWPLVPLATLLAGLYLLQGSVPVSNRQVLDTQVSLAAPSVSTVQITPPDAATPGDMDAQKKSSGVNQPDNSRNARVIFAQPQLLPAIDGDAIAAGNIQLSAKGLARQAGAQPQPEASLDNATDAANPTQTVPDQNIPKASLAIARHGLPTGLGLEATQLADTGSDTRGAAQSVPNILTPTTPDTRRYPLAQHPQIAAYFRRLESGL
jgi:hypothetical protein